MEIPIDEFEQHIDQTILKRGMDYFRSQKVTSCEEVSEGVYEAVVEGNEDYEVTLEIEDGKIVDNECTCPYDRGPYCKHEVAVMCYLQKDALDIKPKKKRATDTPTKRKTAIEKLEELLEKVSHDELKKFVIENAAKDSTFRNIVSANFAHKTAKESTDMYKKQIRALVKAHSHGGFIEYRAARSFGNAMYSLIDKAKEFLAAKKFQSVIFICTAIMEELVDVLHYADDSNADIGGPISTAYELLFELAENESFPNKERVELFEYSLKIFKKGIFAGWDWHLDMLELAVLLVGTKTAAQQIIEAIENGTFSEYEKESAQKIQYDILQKTQGQEVASQFLQKNLSNQYLRKIALEESIGNKDFAKAKSLAEDGIRQDEKSKPGLAVVWYDWLLEIALSENSAADIVKYARYLFVDGYSNHRDYYTILKDHTPTDDWDEYVDALVDSIKSTGRWIDYNRIANIYIREERWLQLFEIVKREPHLSTLENYEQYLSKNFAKELVELYKKSLREFLEEKVNRKAYVEACRYLRRMKKLGGKETVEGLVVEFRGKYPKRKALLEELANV